MHSGGADGIGADSVNDCAHANWACGGADGISADSADGRAHIISGLIDELGLIDEWG